MSWLRLREITMRKKHYLNKTYLEKPFTLLQFIFYCFFNDGGPYHIETGPSIFAANQWTGFYMVGTSIMQELRCLYTRLDFIKFCKFLKTIVLNPLTVWLAVRHFNLVWIKYICEIPRIVMSIILRNLRLL